MSKVAGRVKTYRLPVRERRPPSNKFLHTIKAGMAAAGPPLGPLLGKYGVNIAAFCKDFNQKTANHVKGIPLPCVITVNADRTFTVGLQTPPFTYYLQQAAGISNFELYNGISGKITLKHIYEIAKIKHEDPHSYNQLYDLPYLCRKCIRMAYSRGIEIVDKIDPVEYKQFLQERQAYLDQKAKEAAEEEAKLLKG